LAFFSSLPKAQLWLLLSILSFNSISLWFLINNIIIENHADYGGGIYCESGSPIVRNNKILSNHGGEGGGICADYSNIKIFNNVISKNTSGWGTGIRCRFAPPWNPSHPQIAYNLIVNNKSSWGWGGGGIYVSDGPEPYVWNNIIAGNKAGYYGGAICCYIASCVLCCNTIYGNSATVAGGALYGSGASKFAVADCILWHDNAPQAPEVAVDSWSSFKISYSDVEGSSKGIWKNIEWGYGVIDEDPLFEDPENGDFHLTRTSPCINRSRTMYVPSDDMDGDVRPYMGIADMGADEFVGWHPLEADAFSVPETGGIINFSLKADKGNCDYLIVGGVSGTAPGTPLPGNHANLRVNWDWFSDLEMTLLDSRIFKNFFGHLDALGHGGAQLNVPPMPSGSTGIDFYYAYCCIDPFDFVSNPVIVTVVD